MLANNELHFAASNTFNDPFDCSARKEFEFKDENDLISKMAPLEVSHKKISIKDAVSYLEGITSSPEATDDYIKKKSTLFQKVVLQSFGICSFSEIPDDILLWSHYANGHKGFCIEYSRTDENILKGARPVTYPEDDEFPYVDYWKTEPEEQIEEFAKVVLTKSRHWNYEKEWRILDRPDHIDESYRGHRSTYPNSMLTGIIFGEQMPEKSRKTIRDILTGKPVTFYEAKLIKNRFQISIVQCE